MGHLRLGKLPRTRNWQEVIDLIGLGADTTEIAAATLNASQWGLEQAKGDVGFVYSLWLLTQIPEAARQEDFAAALQQIGLHVSRGPSLLEVVSAFTEAVDSHIGEQGGRSDVGEIAQLAAAESLMALGKERSQTLFGTTAHEVQQAFKSLSTTRQFGLLGKEFFARFMRRHLTYFLSRELSNHVGRGERFSNIDEHSQFNRALDRHCQEASVIVRDFCGEWLSKARHEGVVTSKTTAALAHGALAKLRKELTLRGQADD